MNTTNFSTTQAAVHSADEDFRHHLGNYTILDIAELVSYNIGDNGSGVFGNLKSNRIVEDKYVMYKNVELLSTGNGSCGIQVGFTAGDTYLVFSSHTSLLSTRTRQVDNNTSKMYSVSGMKAIPIASILNFNNKINLDGRGNISIQMPKSSLTFRSDSSIALLQGDDVALVKNPDGSLVMNLYKSALQYRFNTDGSFIKIFFVDKKISEFQARLADGTQIIRRWATAEISKDEAKDPLSFDKYIWQEEYKPDGSYNLIQSDSNDEVVYTKTIDSTGLVNIVCKAGYENTCEGPITLSSKNTVTLIGEKGMTIESKDVTSISSTKELLLEGAGISINGGTKKVALENSAQSLKVLIDELIDICSNYLPMYIPVSGTPTPCTPDPVSVPKFIALKSKIGLLLE